MAHRRLASAAAASLVLLWANSAAAVGMPSVYDNIHNYPIGSRAAGMGGAYTALACDEAAVHYNVAALACAASSRLELAANAYILQALSVPEAFGRGQDVDAVNYHALPSIVGGVRVLLDGDETGAGRLVFGLSVEVPHSLSLTVEPAQPEKPNFLTMSTRDQITTGDIGLGYQIHRVIGVGLAIGAVMRSFESRSSMLLTALNAVPCLPLNSGSCFEYLTSTQDQELTAVGARAKLGIRIAPSGSRLRVPASTSGEAHHLPKSTPPPCSSSTTTTTWASCSALASCGLLARAMLGCRRASPSVLRIRPRASPCRWMLRWAFHAKSKRPTTSSRRR